MTKLKTLLLPTVALALLGAGPVLANDPRNDAAGAAMRDAMFTQADANADGTVTLEEMAAARQAMFTRADANGDGALDAAEREAQLVEQMTALAKARIAAGDRMDADDDGMVTLAEFTARDGRFARLDADGDGAVSKAEFATAGRDRHGRGPGEN